MATKNYKNKYVFLGDSNSINIEIICKSFKRLKHKVSYIIICNKIDLKTYLSKIKSKLKINEIFNPLDFNECKSDYLNIFNIENISRHKYKNLLNQIKIANELSNTNKLDLITMPINKSIFKKNNLKFNGLTEYFGKINKKKTIMAMIGNKFSVIPYTTHINPKDIHLSLNRKKLNSFLNILLILIKQKKYKLKFKNINFLCYNPHCGEDTTLGKEDYLISNILSKFKEISGPYPADSVFQNIKCNSLFISTYHDQSLVPFKILNKKAINLTLGLNYRRLSPAHGTAIDKIYKKKSNNSSYLICMEI